MSVSMIMSLQGLASNENNKAKTVPLKKEKREKTDLPPDSWSQRKPSAPVICVISENDIIIEDTDTNGITLYEVYDEDGFCVASYSSEVDFIAFIINTNQEDVELRFYTDNFIYSGWWVQ